MDARPADIDGSYELPSREARVLVNVGSVGQPRDGDWRASYVVVDNGTIQFRRLSYDVERTLQRFEECPGLPDYLAKRLQEGK